LHNKKGGKGTSASTGRAPLARQWEDTFQGMKRGGDQVEKRWWVVRKPKEGVGKILLKNKDQGN